MIALRPYQQNAVQAVKDEWKKGNRRTLLVLPTGCGKTICFAALTADRVQEGGRVLILAHRGELLRQAADKLKRVTGIDAALEQAGTTAVDAPEPVVVGSVQTLCRERRLTQYPPDYFSTIIVDEAHHVLSDGYQRVLSYFETADVLGVTATPDRGDKKELSAFFDSLAYEYSLRDAVKAGYLAPIRALTIPIPIDLTGVHQTTGDYDAGELGEALEPMLEKIAAEMETICRGRKTVVFLPLIKTAQHFRDILTLHGFTAAEVDGGSSDREEILSDFESGKYNVLCNAMLLTEGWDCPSVDCVIVLRPTRIRSLYCQMVGRGTRLFPGKEDLLLPDFLWHSTRFSLCSPAALVSKDEEQAKKLKEIITECGTPDGGCTLEEAEKQLQKREAADREAALQRELQQNRCRQRRSIDPLAFALSVDLADLADYEPTFRWEQKAPSEKQLRALASFGLETGDVTCAGMASLLLNRLFERSRAGLATPKQINLLSRYGLQAGDWTFEKASATIDSIAKNGWSLPPNMQSAPTAAQKWEW